MTYKDLLARCRRTARRIDRTYARPDTGHIAKALDGDHPGTVAKLHVDHMIARDNQTDQPPIMSTKLRTEIMELWRFVDDLCDFEAHMFCQLLDVIGAVLHGGQVQVVPHAHVNHHGRDCDGPSSSHHVVLLRLSGHPDGEYSVRDLARSHLPIANVTIRVEDAVCAADVEDTGGNLIEVSWAVDHDEGYSGTHIAGCLDWYCNLGEAGQRDVFAEQMGY